MSINAILLELAGNPSRKFKEDLLYQHKDNMVLKQVVRLALDPTINFYIRQIPAYTPAKPNQADTLGAVLDSLHVLSGRQVTGNAAAEYLAKLLSSVVDDDADVIKKVITRDLRCGVSEATANKIWKGLIPEFPYMRCCLPKHTKMDKFDWAGGVFSQLKADGMFANINLYNDYTVELFSRSGSVFPMDQFKGLAEEIANTFIPGTQTHGEVLVKRDGEILPREIGNGILNSVLKGGSFADNEQPVLLVWDQIPLENVTPGGKYDVKYARRYDMLRKQLHDDNTPVLIEMIPTRIVHSVEEAHEHYAEMLAEGYEGTIIKNRTAIWEDTTSKQQVKFKLEQSMELRVYGFTKGNGKNSTTFGALQCRSECGKLEVNVSGFTDKMRQYLSDNRDDVVDSIIEIKGNGIMSPTASNPLYSVFLPRFVEIRTDRTKADDLERILAMFDPTAL